MGYEAKWDWDKIREGYFDSPHKTVREYLINEWDMDGRIIRSGQTTRKLGSFVRLQEEKEAHLLAKKYLKEFKIKSPNELINASRNARANVYSLVAMSVKKLRDQVATEEVEALEVLKLSQGLEKILTLFEQLEQKVEEGYDLTVKQANRGSEHEFPEERVSGDGGVVGNDPQPNLIVRTIDV